MPVLAPESKPVALSRKNASLNSTTPKPNLSLTLPALSTLNVVGSEPFWHPQCAEIQSTLWLPRKIESHGQDSSLSNGSLNYQEDVSRFWMRRLIPNNQALMSPPSLGSLRVFAPATTAEEVTKDAKVIATKKIRFFPENIDAYEQGLALYRRSYNLAVEMMNEGKDKVGDKFIDIRPIIRAVTEKEQKESGRIYNNEFINEAVREAKGKLKDVISKNKKLAKQGAKSGYASLGFKSRKGAYHTFNFPKFPKGGNIAVKALGKVTLTEDVPAESFTKACKVTRDKGRWFLQVQQHIQLNTEKQGQVKCVGVDQGVRTFLTTFSEDDALIIGENFAQEKLFPLMQKVDKLIGQRQKILNHIKPLEVEPQWATDRLKHLTKQIDKLKCRKDDLVLDLHNRAAYELVHRYDVIFLPTFETRGMVSRKGGARTIRRNTCRQMLDLNHYQFKLRLKWYAKKYGKMVADTNEAYTSKTRSWDGVVVPKLGGSKVIKGDGFTVDRDINGARNTLIRNFSMAA